MSQITIKKWTGILNVDGFEIPYLLKTDVRDNIRYSVGQKKINIKLPYQFTDEMIRAELKKVEIWLSKQLKKNEFLRAKFSLKDYSVHDEITVMGDTYTIKIKEAAYSSNHIKMLRDNILEFRLSDRLSPLQKHDVIQRLLSRVMGDFYRYKVAMMVKQINDQYFQEPIRDIKLKYNKSNWGSCSSKRNLNFSTRLLLAPDINVVRYVIVHELAHLKEMNHSPRFWEIVANVMPDYKKYALWLREHGESLDF